MRVGSSLATQEGCQCPLWQRRKPFSISEEWRKEKPKAYPAEESYFEASSEGETSIDTFTAAPP